MLLQHHSHSLHRPTSCARRNAANSSSARRSSSTHASAGASASSTAAAAATASSTAARASHRPMSSPGASPSEQTVSFLNTHGNQLVGTLTTSTSAADRCVILCHGYASFRDGFHLPAIAAALAEAGYNSLRFDFTGNGESEGHFKFSNYVGEMGDIVAAKQYLEQQQGQRVVALLGHSKGGNDVVLYARYHHHPTNDGIPLVINVAGRFDLKEGIEQRFGADIFNRVLHEGPVHLPAQRDDGRTWTWQLTAQDLEERLSLDMAAAAAGVKDVKVLTIHGTADKTIPVEDGRQFAAVLPGHHLVEVEGADHNFTGNPDHLQHLITAVLDFLQQHKDFSLPSPQPADSSSLASS